MNGSSLASARRLCPLTQHLCHSTSLLYPPFNAVAQDCTKRRSLFPPTFCSSLSRRQLSSSWSSGTSRPSWSEEWKQLGLGASLVDGEDTPLTNLLFVQMGFGVDQHGSNDATKAAVRAVRNSIEFNSIPGVIEAVPGGRREMLIQVKLGIPVDPTSSDGTTPMPVDVMQVRKVFPYGKLLPMEIVVGGLSFPTGRVVEELGDTNDTAVCVAACVSIGYNNGTRQSTHTSYNTKDGY